MSDDEDHSKDHWTLLQHYGHRELVSDPLGSLHRPQTTAPKRPEEHESETGSEPSPPAAETSMRGETPSSDHPHLALLLRPPLHCPICYFSLRPLGRLRQACCLQRQREL